MLIDDYIDIKIVPANIKHYTNIGYNCKNGDVIRIKFSELPDLSHKKEKRICDDCNEDYIRQHNMNTITFNTHGKDLCPNCLKKEIYIKEKIKKMNDSCFNNYGAKIPLQSKYLQEKQKATMLEKYGTQYPANSKEIMDKVKATNLVKYGHENPMQNDEIKKKVRNTLYKNDSIPTSKQQIKLKENLEEILKKDVKLVLNYPENTLSLDVALFYQDGIKIDVEYDGCYWHQDQQKDRKRDEFLKSIGYKILRIKSGHLLPSKEQIEESLRYLIEENHSYSCIKLKDWENS